MQTNFSIAQLADPNIEAANDILRKCVHCGFCTATCPTYVLKGDELDSPRGRIYLMKEAFESGKPATPKLAKHLDRCLSCLSCMTTCPASVDYMHLVDYGRTFVQETYTRPLHDRLLRWVLARVLPYPGMFRLSLLGAALGRPFRKLMPARLRAMLELAPKNVPAQSDADLAQVHRAEGDTRMRVALLTGCAQQVLRPAINESTVRILNRLGCEVVIADGIGCCGALVHHMGLEDEGHAAAKRNIAAWEAAEKTHGAIDAIVINASGCGTTVKDYGWMLRNDPAWAVRAQAVSGKTRDISEVLKTLGLGDLTADARPKVAYHSACSMQHGQKLKSEPVELLRDAGFEVVEPAESHLCCGSAGTYNIMQPDWAAELGARKAANIQKLGANCVATGNIGCLTQISSAMQGAGAPPVLHTVELLDWATGGPRPAGLPDV
ncbi:MAG: glycolate oxidase subunit GlcF [Rhodospirillales bacterium]|nr:glycolate oxidase subunit GlcF [Rhodospirillales bacterium]MBO6787099.1 glycolate oxidase subunit GlcF [Rhodospirillales bacterium]